MMEYHMIREQYTSVVLPGFPPEPTAPLVDMSDPEYNPYINKECEHDEII